MKSRTAQLFLVLGGASAAIGVAAGAFGAHGLKAILTPDLLLTYETAVRYQMYHAIALLVAGWLAAQGPLRAVRLAGWCFIAGTVLFSGSLYVLTLSGVRWWGAVAPLGGLTFIAGWILLAVAAWHQFKS